MTDLRLLIALLLAFGGQVFGADTASRIQRSGSFRTTLSRSVAYDYLLFLPSAYGAQAERRWPTILFLHSTGEAGANLALLLKKGPPGLIESTTAESSASQTASEAAKAITSEFIVISPQCPVGQGWDADALLALVDDVSAKHRVDTSRVYLTGFSMGGFGTWSLGMKYPNRFAAISPICGGGDLVEVGAGLPHKRAALQSLPIWVFHGAKDTQVPVSESERMIAAVKRVSGNNDVQFTVYPEAGHDCWTQTYNNPELFRWFLQHKR